MSKPQTLDEMSDIQQFLLAFRAVERVIPIPNSQAKYENDVEHSYFLAMACWYLADKLKLRLNRTRLFEYSLVHDLPEALAGDVDAFASPAERSQKEIDEAHAVTEIKSRFGMVFPGMVTALLAYEAQQDSESKFVKAVDKLLPMVMIALDKGRCWHDRGVTFDILAANKMEKTAISKPAQQLCQEIVEYLETQPHLFPQPSIENRPV